MSPSPSSLCHRCLPAYTVQVDCCHRHPGESESCSAQDLSASPNAVMHAYPRIVGRHPEPGSAGSRLDASTTLGAIVRHIVLVGMLTAGPWTVAAQPAPAVLVERNVVYGM